MAIDQVFGALGDPTRRGILELLSRRERTAGELLERFPLSQPALSKHLRVLREAGLVSVRPEGTRRVYAVREEGLEAVRVWLARLIPSAPS
jgi:DNA-binding transcriptional ArsR family regulator